MHPFFQPLDERDSMLLSTALTVGGAEATRLFAHLRPERRAPLEERAAALLALPREKRLGLLVHEMKRLLSAQGSRGLDEVDPTWLAAALEGESPRIVAAVLVSLPPRAVRAVLELLPAALRRMLPSRNEARRLSPELREQVRHAFESRFVQRPAARGPALGFRDVAQLERDELRALVRDLGLTELAHAFVSVGKLGLRDLCRRLPAECASELVAAFRSASPASAPDLGTAQRFLARVAGQPVDAEELLRRAGLWRLARASVREPASFRAALCHRLARNAGRLLDAYLGSADELGDPGEDAVAALQDSILLRVRELGRAGRLGSCHASVGVRDVDTATERADGGPAVREPHAARRHPRGDDRRP